MIHENSPTIARVAILTVSDTRTSAIDHSGDLASSILESAGHVATARSIVPDESEDIQTCVRMWVEDDAIDAIIVTGGTGASHRDITPETLVPMFATTMQGFGELFRHLSFVEIGSSAMLSRADAGWVDCGDSRTPIFLLPGSPKAVQLAMEKLIVPQLGHLLDVCGMEQQQ